MTRWPRFRLILPKLSFVCCVKSNPPVGSQTIGGETASPVRHAGDAHFARRVEELCWMSELTTVCWRTPG